MKTKAVATKNEIETAVRTFGECMGNATKSLEAAARVYHAAVSKHGREAKRAFEAAYPAVDAEFWNRLYSVGSGLAVPETLYFSDRSARLIERLPIAEQKQMLSGVQKVTVITPRGRVVEKPLARLTRKEEEILIRDDGRLRTMSEMQEAFAAAKSIRIPDYEVRGRQLIVHRPYNFGKRELQQILEEMP